MPGAYAASVQLKLRFSGKSGSGGPTEAGVLIVIFGAPTL